MNRQLYKMLIYEEGCFFLPHRDSEKQDGMVATLVISLPSMHRGGSLIVSHDGLTEEIDLSPPDGAYRFQYAAFYTDCEHEVTALESGHRICLIYNLLVDRRSPQPGPPLLASKVDRVTELLKMRFDASDTDKYAIPLAHGYSENGLSPDLIKGRDRSIVNVLSRAAHKLNYRCHLALLTHFQEGGVDEGTVEYGYNYTDYADAEMIEVFEESFTSSHWLDIDGNPCAYGEMGIEVDELPAWLITEELDCEQTVHAPTGNEGTTMERWYRSALVVIWPEDRHYRIVAQQGQGISIPILADMIARSRKPAKDGEILAFAKLIIMMWRLPRNEWMKKSPDNREMAKLLKKLGDAEMADLFRLSSCCQMFGSSKTESKSNHARAR